MRPLTGSSDLDQCNNFQICPAAELEAALKGQNLTLQSACVVFRHGERTPFTPDCAVFDGTLNYLHDNESIFDGKEDYLYKDTLLISVADGELLDTAELLQFDHSVNMEAQLTTNGAKQLNDLGCYLKDRFANYAKCRLISSDVQVYSTCTERTIQSARAVLKTLLEGSFEGRVPICIADNWTDSNILISPVNRYQQLRYSFGRVQDLDEKMTWPGFKEWMDDFSERTGVPPNTDLMTIRDILQTYNVFNLEGLSGMKDDDLENSDVQCCYLGAKELLLAENGIKIGSSHFFAAIGSNLAESDHKLYLYSGHDTSINMIRTALRCHNFKWPRFAFSISFELYVPMGQANQDDSSRTRSQVSSRNASRFVVVLIDRVPVILKHFSDSPLIPLDKFLDIGNHL